MSPAWTPAAGPQTVGTQIRKTYNARHHYPGKLIGGAWVLMHAWGSELWTAFLLGPEGGHIISNGTEWDVVDRPRRDPLTEQSHSRCLEMEVDALYDTFTQRPIAANLPRHSVEYELWKLEQLAERFAEGNSAYAPTVKLFGPVPHADKRWVIDNLSWGDATRDPNFGGRMRQQVTIHLKRFGAAENIVRSAQAQTRKYKIAKGDDLQKIAKKTLGKAARWREIEKLNKGMRGIKLNAKQFPVGKQILVPAK